MADKNNIKNIVREASEIIAYHYPMRTFVHHNPLHELENLPFEEALREGARSLGSNEYLPIENYRDYLKNGRINESHIDDALLAYSTDKTVTIADKKITRLDVLKSHLISGLANSDCYKTDNLPTKPHLNKIIELLNSINNNSTGGSIDEFIDNDLKNIGINITLSDWVQKTVGSTFEQSLNELIDFELIKWCESFLDENHAKWIMPYREKGFYNAWKFLAKNECSIFDIKDFKNKLDNLPDNPEDSIEESLTEMGIKVEDWKDYITRHLTSMPGWTGFIKWREDQTENPWQLTNPAFLTDYIAIRLWLEKELTEKICNDQLAIGANVTSIKNYIKSHKESYFLRSIRLNNFINTKYSKQIDRLLLSNNSDENSNWIALASEYIEELNLFESKFKNWLNAWNLLSLADGLNINPTELDKTSADDLKTIIDWTNGFSPSEQGLVWLKSFEAGYKSPLLKKIKSNIESNSSEPVPTRPKTQSVYCIDVRSEPFRRHLESIKDENNNTLHNTYGFAGFFSLFIKHRALVSNFEVDHFPVVMSAKNTIREVPQTDQGSKLIEHRKKGKFSKAAYALYSNLKEHVITPYVMVESIGWFYSIPIIGKTLFTNFYNKSALWIKSKWMPHIKTQMTIDKPTKDEADDMLTFNQHHIIRRALHEKFPNAAQHAPNDFIEFLRVSAMAEDSKFKPLDNQILSSKEQVACINELKNNYHINPSWAKSGMSRIMQLGLTFEEQVTTIGTALRMMGLTDNFARLILLCGHGSTTDNNPFEAALDCGACGGNSGAPNARVFADIANKDSVRDALRGEGIDIPEDTIFVAGKHDTTTDIVTFFDVEDLSETHRKELDDFQSDLDKTTTLNAKERCGRFPELSKNISPNKAKEIVFERSADWSQVRPEWGLSGNAAFIIGRRYLSKDTDLQGRVFLHSYDYKLDSDGKLLETLMTAPQVVAQWINMEHYFSTVDNDVFGSGSKIYHNVVCKNGIMFGSHSDLRTGLPMQTVMAEGKPYHEPMRLLTIIEAPTESISKIIEKHSILQNYYDNEWVQLVSINPNDKSFNQYIPNKGWELFESKAT